MTVEKLIRMLEKHNKDAKVKLHAKEGEEVLFVVSQMGDEENVYLECESDNDMSEEISARMRYAVENDIDELDFYMEMLEDGIDVEMVRKFVSDEAADHMQEFCEEHGLLDSVNMVVMNCDDRLVEYEWDSKEAFLKAMNSDEENIPMLDDSVNTLTIGTKCHNENDLNDIGITTVADVIQKFKRC